MKRKFTKIFSCLLISSVIFTTGCTSNKNNINKDTVLAKLGDFSVSKEIIDKEIQPTLDIQKQIYPDITDNDLAAMKESLISSTTIYLSQTEAICKEAEKNKFKLDEKLFEEQYKELEDYISMYFQMTLSEFMKKYNFTEEYVKENFKKQIIVQEYLKSCINIKDKDIEDYYNKNKEEFRIVRASHILISNSNEHPEGEHEHTDGDNEHANLSKEEQKKLEENKKANKKKALEILNKAKAGEDFKALSDKYSDDTGAKETGGDLDYFSRGQMVTEFEEACFDKNFKPGEIYKDIVETSYGYHIIKKTDDKITSLDECKDYIKEQVLYQEELSKFLESVLEKYNIEYHSSIETTKS